MVCYGLLWSAMVCYGLLSWQGRLKGALGSTNRAFWMLDHGSKDGQKVVKDHDFTALHAAARGASTVTVSTCLPLHGFPAGPIERRVDLLWSAMVCYGLLWSAIMVCFGLLWSGP